ncbi:MAG TPA: hypothetical protein VHQ03_05985 [Candidatus Dormibacteraeota bacterium]|nr:hypothetical protein [Candidatus Dormibacteraeota bacterium]
MTLGIPSALRVLCVEGVDIEVVDAAPTKAEVDRRALAKSDCNHSVAVEESPIGVTVEERSAINHGKFEKAFQIGALNLSK